MRVAIELARVHVGVSLGVAMRCRCVPWVPSRRMQFPALSPAPPMRQRPLSKPTLSAPAHGRYDPSLKTCIRTVVCLTVRVAYARA